MAFTTYDLINDVLNDYSGSDPTEGSGYGQRANILRAAQRLSEKVWYRTDWNFKYQDGESALTDGGGYLPSDFHQVGTKGVVYKDVAKPLSWVPISDMKRMHEIFSQEGEIQFYSIGQTSNDSGTRRRTILCYPLETTTVYLFYERSAPILADQETPTTDGMIEWPVEFYQVLYEGVVWQRMKSVGDSRQNTQKNDFMEALRDQVIAHTQGREQGHQVQPFPGRNV